MTEKSLTLLADEYAENIAELERQIHNCRRSIEKAKQSKRNMAVNRLTRNLTVLYDQRNELREIEFHLRSYYDSDVSQAV